jgi:hypothetical protein
MFHIYSTNVGKNRTISEAMATGTGFPIVPPAPLMPGGIILYGCLRGLLPTLRQAQSEKREWVYLDNAYFGRDRFFRATRNAYQHDGAGDAGPERWEALGLAIKPWRKAGRHIVLCPPEPIATNLWGVRSDWLEATVAELAKHTDRSIRIRRRIGNRLMPGVPSLESDLKDAWALVCWRSNAAVEALLAGVPVVCDPAAAAFRMSGMISGVENPRMPDDREEWAACLANNQWTVAEMRDGTCWRELNTQ